MYGELTAIRGEEVESKDRLIEHAHTKDTHDEASHFFRHQQPQHESRSGQLLGKPIAESNALFLPTGIYPFSVGATMAYKAIFGKVSPLPCELGWKLLGLLELTALPSIDRNAWVSICQKPMHSSSGAESAVPELLDERVWHRIEDRLKPHRISIKRNALSSLQGLRP